MNRETLAGTATDPSDNTTTTSYTADDQVAEDLAQVATPVIIASAQDWARAPVAGAPAAPPES